MNLGIIFSLLAAILFGLWTIFHNRAANDISPLLGAIVVSLTAVIFGSLIYFRLVELCMAFN